MMMMMKLPILPCAEKLELVFITKDVCVRFDRDLLQCLWAVGWTTGNTCKISLWRPNSGTQF